MAGERESFQKLTDVLMEVFDWSRGTCHICPSTLNFKIVDLCVHFLELQKSIFVCLFVIMFGKV